MVAVIILGTPTLFMFPAGDSLLPVPQSRHTGLRMLILREVATFLKMLRNFWLQSK